ncbi:MAG: HTH-type transcriptional regulator / antitoxin HigA [Actinomycetota bacterium]|jgi:HTH-type transcriptional regulator/antitoxin HigA|nr:HTH-type transcriptional regulator / antitoxin HigA [Actinomycetota bacterium]
MTNVMAPAETFSPGEFLRDELAERGWSEAEFADILGRPAQAVSEILNGKKEITTETAVAIGAALGTSAELWLNLQSAFRLHKLRAEPSGSRDVERRAQLRRLVPVREAQKRRWLPDTKDLDALETAVCEFLGIASPADWPDFRAAARRVNVGTQFTPEQNAWLARVRALGAARVSRPLDLGGLRALAEQITRRLHDPIDLAGLHTWLADVGVALVVELPLKAGKIDGVVIFGEDGTPIIGLSTRGDRMDSVVFTLLHEIAHLVLEHVVVGDVRLDEAVLDETGTGIEAQANELAARWVLPSPPKLGPAKPTMPQIIRAAHDLGVHPSFIIGRLQQNKVLDRSDYRRSVPKVRPFLKIG